MTRLYSNVNDHKAYSYRLVTGPAVLAVSLSSVKDFLKLDSSDTSEDDILTLFIEAATDYAEKYTKRDFINKTYITYRDRLSDIVEIRRSWLQSISFIKYYDSNEVLQTLSSLTYSSTISDTFSSIYRLQSSTYPYNVSSRPGAVQIQFIAGYGADASFIPPALIQAILQHVANLYANRGDCTDAAGCDCGGTLPKSAKALYDSYRINDINGRPNDTWLRF